MDSNVGGTFGRTGCIHYVDGSWVIFMKDGRAGLGKAKFVKDGTKILGNFGLQYISNEVGFGRAGDDGRLDLGLVGNSGTSKAEAETGDRAVSSRASGTRGTDKTREFER